MHEPPLAPIFFFFFCIHPWRCHGHSLQVVPLPTSVLVLAKDTISMPPLLNGVWGIMCGVAPLSVHPDFFTWFMETPWVEFVHYLAQGYYMKCKSADYIFCCPNSIDVLWSIHLCMCSPKISLQHAMRKTSVQIFLMYLAQVYCMRF